jgi:hypothetical protein
VGGAASTGISTIGGVLGTGALATAGSIGAAAAGVGAAGYEAYKLCKVTAGFSDWGGNVGKANTPEQYDALMARQPKAAPAPQDTKQLEAAQLQMTAAKAMQDAAKMMAAAKGEDPNRTKPIVGRAP